MPYEQRYCNVKFEFWKFIFKKCHYRRPRKSCTVATLDARGVSDQAWQWRTHQWFERSCSGFDYRFAELLMIKGTQQETLTI